ncbi:hypothetical protein Hanom_Chr13g01197161 [Helianthus anomalus]
MLKKLASVDMTTGQPQTSDAKKPENNKDKEKMDVPQMSQWTSTWVEKAEEFMKTVEKNTTPKNQLVKVLEKQPLDVAPVSQKWPRNMSLQ